MSIISVPNLKEIETWEGYFYGVKKKKNVKKIRQFLGTNISRSAKAFPLILICEIVYM